MTISQLAEIAIKENRTVKCVREESDSFTQWLRADSLCIHINTEDLAANDWYEVKE